MSTIVKIERDPISPCNKVLINNESESIRYSTEMTDELDKHLKDKDTIYAKVSFAADKFKLIGLVKRQSW